MSIKTKAAIRVQTPRLDLVGTATVLDGWQVMYVKDSSEAAIRYERNAANISRIGDRPWKLGDRSFGSLALALCACEADSALSTASGL